MDHLVRIAVEIMLDGIAHNIDADLDVTTVTSTTPAT